MKENVSGCFFSEHSVVDQNESTAQSADSTVEMSLSLYWLSEARCCSDHWTICCIFCIVFVLLYFLYLF